MFVCGANDSYQIDKNSNRKNSNRNPIIYPCIKFHIDPSTMLAFSTYSDHTVWITQDGKAYAIGNNTDGRIWNSLPKKKIIKDKEIIMNDQIVQPFKFTSVACCHYGTLYLGSLQSDKNNYMLVYCHRYTDLIILNITFSSPVSLFGSYNASGVIDNSGGIIVINESNFKFRLKKIKPAFLPLGDKAVKLALYDIFVISLGLSGRVYESQILEENELKFTEIPEFREKTVVDISGDYNYCFVVLSDGRVFGRGSNLHCKLGFPGKIDSVSTFTLIKSLNKYNIVSVFAGGSSAIFKTDKNEMIVCGENTCGQCFIPPQTAVYPPVEVKEFSNFNFCVTNFVSAAFVGIDPPPNIANKKICTTSIKHSQTDSKLSQTNSKPKIKPKISAVTENSTDSTQEIERLKKELSLKEEEINKLKNANSKYDKEISSLKSIISEMKKQSNTSSSTQKNIEKQMKITIQILGEKEMSSLQKVKKIGRGATSEVFEVTRQERLALKVLDFELCKRADNDKESDSEDDDDDDDDDDDKAENFIDIDKLKGLVKECEVLNQLDHKNIIKTFGVFFGNRHQEPSILLEFCESNLKKRVKKLTIEERRLVIIEISSAMKEVHRLGIIHRDLKLENILLDSNNHVKVSDFGLCTFIKNDDETMSHTQMAGSLKYMAPELIQGRTDYNEKVDVYSFGVVVFVILSKGEFPSISIADVGNGKQASIPSSFTNFSKQLIQDCWSSKPSDRPSFADIVSRIKGNENKLI